MHSPGAEVLSPLNDPMQLLACAYFKNTKGTRLLANRGSDAWCHLEVLRWASGIKQRPADGSEVVGCNGGCRSLLTEVLVELCLRVRSKVAELRA